MSAQPNKPIKAKLGEASSFVYDPELKRWINKKAGAEQADTRSATPPPPRNAPPRTSSGPPGVGIGMGVAGPTSAPRPAMGNGAAGLAQRAVSESSGMHHPAPSSQSRNQVPSLSDGATETNTSTHGQGLVPPAMMRSASSGSATSAIGPPSRPSTGMSMASSIDDLLGPPGAGIGGSRKGAKGKKKGRGYVDVMGGTGS